MSQTFARLVSAIPLACTLSVAVHSQAIPGKAWQRQQDRIESLMMRIEGGNSRCQVGVIVGWHDTSVFVATAQSALLAEVEPAFRLRSPSEERRNGGKPRPLAGRLLDQGDGIAALAIDNAAFAKWVASTVRFDVVGDDANAMRTDQIFFPSCQESDRKPPVLSPIMRIQNGHFAFQGGDIGVDNRETYIGAPLVQVFGDNLLIIGFVSNVAERSDALPLGPALQRIAGWGAPVSLTAPSARRDCRYRVTVVRPSAGTQPVIFGSRGGENHEITVETAPDCPWTAFADGASWIAVSARSLSAEANGNQTGPGTAIVRSTQGNRCDGTDIDTEAEAED